MALVFSDRDPFEARDQRSL